MLTWRCFKSSLLQLHSARRISKRNVCARHVRALLLPFHAAFFFLSRFYFTPLVILWSRRLEICRGNQFIATRTRRVPLFANNFSTCKLRLWDLVLFQSNRLPRLSHFCLNTDFFNKFKVDFSWKFLWSKFVNESKKRTSWDFHVPDWIELYNILRYYSYKNLVFEIII